MDVTVPTSPPRDEDLMLDEPPTTFLVPTPLPEEEETDQTLPEEDVSEEQAQDPTAANQNSDRYTSYAEWKRWFEKKFSQITEVEGLYYNDKKEKYYTKEVMIRMYEHHRKGNYIRKWLKDDNRRTYDDVGIYPVEDDCPPKHLNLWKPFAYAKPMTYDVDERALAIFRKHILILCKHDVKVAYYVEGFIGQLLKYPAFKIGICLAFTSKPGAGKGKLIKVICDMLGVNRWFPTANPADVFTRFNGRLINAFLVIFDEVSKQDFAGNTYKQFKRLLTEATIPMEEKGKSPTSIQSYHRVIITTNSDEPLPTDKTDRRSLIIRCSDELCNNKAYFDDWDRTMNNPAALKTIYHHLIGLPDLDTFIKWPVPHTEYHEDVKEAAISAPEQWLRDLCLDTVPKEPKTISSAYCLSLFKDFCFKNGIFYETSTVKLGLKLKAINIPGVTKGPHKEHGATWIFDYPLMRKHFRVE
jgi:hypothetical protein